MQVPARLKVAVADLLCSRPVGECIAAIFPDRVPSAGLWIDAPSPDITPDTKARLLWGLYERAEIRMLERHLPPFLDVVELGASIGAVSAHIARRLDPSRRLVCVEPNSRLLTLVRANVRRQAPDLRLDLVDGAIVYAATEEREVPLSVGERNVDSRLATERTPATTMVPAWTLGRLLPHCRIERYALVMDIEGAEAGVLYDDGAALTGCAWMMAELHDTVHRDRRLGVEDLVAQLTSLGFEVIARRGPVVVAARPEARST